MSNKVKIVTGIILGVLICVGFIVGIVKNNNSNKVKFEDPEMEKLLIKVSGVKETKKFREDDLDKITELNIGCVEHYSTLQDIKKCKNLKKLLIGDRHSITIRYYGVCPATIYETNVTQIERELCDILDCCKELETLRLYNKTGQLELTDLYFLENRTELKELALWNIHTVEYDDIKACTKLEYLDIAYTGFSDYEMLQEFKELESLYLEGLDIDEARYILELKKLKSLFLDDTPLSENEEEVNKIREKIKNIDISLK